MPERDRDESGRPRSTRPRDALGVSVAEQPPIPLRASSVSGGRLLATDLRIATLLLNDARYRAFQRVFALERKDVNLITLIALLVTTLPLASSMSALSLRRERPETGLPSPWGERL